MPILTLQSPRLILRPWVLEDIDELHALWTRPEVRRYLWDDVAITRERAEDVVREFIAPQDSNGVGGWLLLDRETDASIGFAALVRREPGDPELMYGLAPEWWGRGLATEAGRAVLSYAFGVLGCARVTAATDVPNVASTRVMERLGMRFSHRGMLNGVETMFYEARCDDFVTGPNRVRR